MQYLILILSIIEVVLMGYDKHQSQVGGRRTPEKVLLVLGIVGGAIGGLIGMRAFRHKTKKTYFWVIFGLAAILHLVLLGSNDNGLLAQLRILPSTQLLKHYFCASFIIIRYF